MLNRDEFVKVLKEYGCTDLILDVFDYGSLHETETFIFHNEPSGDVSIIDKTTLDSKPRVINWYKLTHIGRALNIYGFNSWEEFVDTLHNIRDELKAYLPKVDTHYNEKAVKQVDSERVAKNIKKIQMNSFYGSTVDVNSLYPVIIAPRGSGKSHYERIIKKRKLNTND